MPLAAKLWISTGLFSSTFIVVKGVVANQKIKQEPISEVLKDLVEVPKYSQELGFVHQVEKDLRRVFNSLPTDNGLVIFIDDLDRCSPSKVANVLEAVNLFLAGDFPDCCFVLGMDAEMVAAALQFAHRDMTANLPSDARIPIGWRFMDKFVQLPFVIPQVDGAMQQVFINHLTGNSADQELEQVAGLRESAANLKELRVILRMGVFGQQRSFIEQPAQSNWLARQMIVSAFVMRVRDF
ncbi:hypothetical protein P3T25_009823 [Paraburkholderia sp. GAS32]